MLQLNPYLIEIVLLAMSPTRISACHVAPVFLSARETTDKAIKCIRQVAENDAKVVVFPEAFIPAFPAWNVLRPPTENHDLFERMAKESVYADGDEIQALRDVARETKTVISIGFSEKVHFSAACLYNSNILIGTGGEIFLHHRKLMPTFYEKIDLEPRRWPWTTCGENRIWSYRESDLW